MWRVGTHSEQVPWGAAPTGEHKGKGRGYNHVSEVEVGNPLGAQQTRDDTLLMTDGELGSLEREARQGHGLRALRPIRIHNRVEELSGEDLGDEENDMGNDTRTQHQAPCMLSSTHPPTTRKKCPGCHPELALLALVIIALEYPRIGRLTRRRLSGRRWMMGTRIWTRFRS